ncbi:MAG TPA: MFS transporter [Candidatus Limnocylindrales bacterium]|nr:MFS transporter [Candidatus Limnocylindrales bacterium]
MSAVLGLRTQLTLSLRVVRAILGSPALRHVEVAFLLFNAVEYGTWIAILLYAYGATGPASVGLVAVCQLVPAAVVAPLWANLADRYPRDRVLFGGYLVQAGGFGLTTVAMALAAPPIIVYAGAAAAATSLTITRPTQGALLPSVSRTPEELTAANGLSGTVEGTGLMLGPLVAAGILAIASPTAVIAAGAAACLVAAALVARLPMPSSPPTVAGDPPAADALLPPDGLLSGIRTVRRSGATRLVIGILALRLVTVGATDVLFVLLALEVFHIGDSGASLLSASLGLGMVAGGAVMFSLVGRQRLAPVLAVAAVVWGACLVLVGTVAPVWLAMPLIAAGGIGYAACDVVGRTILQRVTADRMLARVLGALEGIGMIGLAVGALIAPLIVALVGIESALVVVGLLLPLGVLLGWSGLRAIDRTALVPTRALDLLRAGAVFAPLAPPQLEVVGRRSRWLTVEPGEVIIREGDPGDAYYVLESGEVSVSQAGRHLRVTTERGQGFGEIALLRDVPRTATVTAVRPTVLLMLGRADFLEAVTGHPQAHDEAHRVAAERAPLESAG